VRHVESAGRAGGAVVNIASIEGRQPAPGHAHYAASKAALLMFTKAAALELGSLGIRVNAVSPGLVHREGIEEAWPEGVERWQSAAPLKRLGQPADIADAALFLASDAARWITGAELVVDGGVSTRPTWRGTSMADLQDRRIAVTGGAGGIARGIAEAILEAGGRVALMDLDEAKTARLAQGLDGTGERALAVAADVTLPESLDTAFDRIIARFGTLSGLVNNAGVIRLGAA